LEQFFEENKDDLSKAGNIFGTISVEDAINRTLSEASKFEKYIKRNIESKSNDDFMLEDLFIPLDNSNKSILKYQKNKAYGVNIRSWLRLYAIRLDFNKYIITGGAIKLTRTMNEREHTKKELSKLDKVKEYLKEGGIEDISDLDIMELGI
jgi:hypothetical protein